MLSWIWLVVSFACFADAGGATPTLSIVPDTLAHGVRPSNWNITVSELAPMVPGPSNFVHWSAYKPLFLVNPSSSPAIPIAGCTATFLDSSRTTMMLRLILLGTAVRACASPAVGTAPGANDCALGGTFSFTVPGAYLAPNLRGNVSVTLSFSTNSLRTVIYFTAVPATFTVHPDTVAIGAQPAYWNVTVYGIDPLNLFLPSQSIYLSTCCSQSMFVVTPSAKLMGYVAGCAAHASTTATVMRIYLPDGCEMSGVFWFIIPATFLAINSATGNVSVYVRFGDDGMWTLIEYPGSPSPSPQPSPSPSFLQYPVTAALLVSVLISIPLCILIQLLPRPKPMQSMLPT